MAYVTRLAPLQLARDGCLFAAFTSYFEVPCHELAPADYTEVSLLVHLVFVQRLFRSPLVSLFFIRLASCNPPRPPPPPPPAGLMGRPTYLPPFSKILKTRRRSRNL